MNYILKIILQKEDNKTNLEVNKLTLECLESKNNTFKLDEMGNLRVNSISTVGPKPDIVSQKGAIYLSSNSINPSEYFGGIWRQKKTNSLFGENIIDKEFLTQQSSNTITISASESNAVEYNIEGKCEQEEESSPSKPTEIKTIKGIRNYFNKNDTSNGYLNVANGEIVANNDWITTNFILLENNTPNVTIIGNSGNKEGYCFYDSEKTYIIGGSMAPNINKSILVPSNARYFKITVSKNVINQYAIYFNGSINSPYVPYGSWLKVKISNLENKEDNNYHVKEILIDMNKYDENKNIIGNYELNSINNVKDTLEVVSGHLEKRIGKIVLDGTQPMSGFDISSENTTRISFNNILLKNANIEEGIKSVLCNRLSCVSMWARDIEGIYLTATHVILRINKNTIGTTINEINAYLSSHPLEIYYVLAEPEEIQLIPTNIPLFEGENHITLEENIETNTELKYKPYLTIFVWERISE